jgi:hypothetical protein
MIEEFVSSPQGAYALSAVLGVAVGLVGTMQQSRAWLATVLVTFVFVATASTLWPEAPFATPLFVVTMGVTVILATAVDLRNSPLLVDEPWWRKVILVAAHGSTVRAAADVEAGEHARQSVPLSPVLVAEAETMGSSVATPSSSRS